MYRTNGALLGIAQVQKLDLFPSPHLHALASAAITSSPQLWAHPAWVSCLTQPISAPALLMTFTLQPVVSSKAYP